MSHVQQPKAVPLYWDGAMGTELWHQYPGPLNMAELVRYPLTHAPWVQSIHRQYLAAGAQGLTTHSFCANRAYLSQYGWEEDCQSINITAAQLARQCLDEVEQKGRIAGSIGPLPPTLGTAEQTSLYQEQAQALVQGGVDLLLIETQLHLSTALIAIHAAHQAMAQIHREVPLIVSFSLATATTLTDGCEIPRLCAALSNQGIDGLGLNCCQGPTSLLQALPILVEHSHWFLWIRPSAGIPHQTTNGQWVYPFTPAAFAAALQPLMAQLPLAVVGGCCGTTPPHIQELVTCGTH